MNLNWYKDYLEKKDNTTISFNKYTTAQTKTNEEMVKKPYYLVRMVSDGAKIVESLKNAREWAFSPSQARLLFFRKYKFLSDYVNMGIPLEAKLDVKLWNDTQNIKEYEKEKKERTERDLPEQWWNK